MKEAAPLLEQSGFGVLVPGWWTGQGAAAGAGRKPKSKSPANERAALPRHPGELRLGDHPRRPADQPRRVRAAGRAQDAAGAGARAVGRARPGALAAGARLLRRSARAQMSLATRCRWLLDGEARALRRGRRTGRRGVEGRLRELLDQPDAHSAARRSRRQPTVCTAQLRPYQLARLFVAGVPARFGLGACLADDMGLGKTIQTIALLLHERERPRRSDARRCWSARPRWSATGGGSWSASRRRCG